MFINGGIFKYVVVDPNNNKTNISISEKFSTCGLQTFKVPRSFYGFSMLKLFSWKWRPLHFHCVDICTDSAKVMLYVNYCVTDHPWRRQWHPTPVLLPGKSHGRRSLVGCSPWGRCQSDTTERLHFHFSLSCIGGGNGNPLQCSCLENPRDGGAWWAAVHGIAQSRTRLKRLSSSSSSNRSSQGLVT